MFRAICFSDLHIDNYAKFSKERSRLKNCISVLDLVFAEAEKRDISLICFCGDLFDKSVTISMAAFNATILKFIELFDKYPDVNFIAIPGNHDYITKPELGKNVETSMDLLNTLFARFILLKHYQKPVVTENNVVIYGVEFFYHHEEYLQAIKNIKVDKDCVNILLTHVTWTDIIGLNTGISPYIDLYDKFDYVLAGDIHKRKDFGNRLMLGSPLHKDLSDLGDSKGIWEIAVDKEGVKKREFICTDDIFPVYRKINEGENIRSGWEKDYIVYTPIHKNEEENENIEQVIANNFGNGNDLEVITAFIKTTDLKDKNIYIQKGIDYLSKV